MRFKTLLILFLVSLGFVFSPANVFAEDDCPEEDKVCTGEGEDELCFCFDEDDKIETPDGEAERTFSIPPIKMGFVFDFHNTDLLPHFGIQIFSIGDISADFAVARSRVFISLNWELVPIIKLGPSVWAGYNVRETEPAYGVGVSILNF